MLAYYLTSCPCRHRQCTACPSVGVQQVAMVTRWFPRWVGDRILASLYSLGKLAAVVKAGGTGGTAGRAGTTDVVK